MILLIKNIESRVLHGQQRETLDEIPLGLEAGPVLPDFVVVVLDFAVIAEAVVV